MRCPKCNNENPDDAVYCPGCYAVLLKVDSIKAEPASEPGQPSPEPGQPSPEPGQPAPDAGQSAPKPAPKRRQPVQGPTTALPWRQVAVIGGIALGTLLLVSGALWFFCGRGEPDVVAVDSAATVAQKALDHALSEARAAGGEKVALERITMLTEAPVAQKNIPSQTLGTYAGWVLKKAQAVLADSGRDCRVTVQVTLHPEAMPTFRISSAQDQLDASLQQHLHRELEMIDPLHTSAQDVSFAADFTVKSGGGAAPVAAAESRGPKAPQIDVEAVRQACGVEIGMFCNGQNGKPAALVGCLRGHSQDLLDACRQSLSIPKE